MESRRVWCSRVKRSQPLGPILLCFERWPAATSGSANWRQEQPHQPNRSRHREGLSDSYVRHMVPLALLAPAIVESICAGRQGVCLSAERLKDSGRRSDRMGCTAAAAGGLEAAALPFSPLTSKDPIDPGEGSSVNRATARAQLVAPNLFQTERNCAELAIPKIARSLRCHELSESARPRADLPPSPNCMRILQTVWRRGRDSNPRSR